MRAYLLRALRSEALPAVLLPLLSEESRQPAPENRLERQLVLRTQSAEILDYIYQAPALRELMGERLGPKAALARSRRSAALRRALAEEGITLADEE